MYENLNPIVFLKQRSVCIINRNLCGNIAQLFTSVSVKVVDIFTTIIALHFDESLSNITN